MTVVYMESFKLPYGSNSAITATNESGFLNSGVATMVIDDVTLCTMTPHTAGTFGFTPAYGLGYTRPKTVGSMTYPTGLKVDPRHAVFDSRRRGKWYIHVSTYGVSQSSNLTFTYTNADAESVPVAYSHSLGNTTRYHEVIIDWDAGTLQYLLDAVLVEEYAFTSIDSVITIGAMIGGTASAPLYYDNAYIVIDLPDDPEPTGRLGPCNLKNVDFTAVESERGTVDTETMIATMNASACTIASKGASIGTAKERVLFSGLPTVADTVLAAKVSVRGYLPPKVFVPGINVDVGDERIGPLELSASTVTAGANVIFEHDANGTPMRDSSLDKLPVIGVSTAK